MYINNLAQCQTHITHSIEGNFCDCVVFALVLCLFCSCSPVTLAYNVSNKLFKSVMLE